MLRSSRAVKVPCRSGYGHNPLTIPKLHNHYTQTLPDLICLACSQEDIAVRRVYEEGKEAAPPSKCSKSGAHNSGESYIWQHMTRVYVKGEAGSAAAPSLLYGICHECDKALRCPDKFGNGNLNKHLARVHDIHPPCKTQCVMTEGKGVGRRAVRV